MKTPSSGLPPVWQYGGYELDPSHFVTSMVHLYRAEVGRANLWRSRLDTTTNWAVVTTGAALTFAFSSSQNPHFVLLLVLLLVLTFLLIEARRYSYYALWYHRVRLLERGFFATMMAPPNEPPPGWAAALHETLESPSFVMPRWRSAALRLRRNYVWIVTLVLISWLLKLSVHPQPIADFSHIVERAAIGQVVSGPWVISVVGGVYLGLLCLIAVIYLFPPRTEGHPREYERRELVLETAPQEQMAIIITNKREEVAATLMQNLQRGVTALQGTGMYTGQSRDVLFCALTSAQETELREIVQQTDPEAFVILTAARDVRGRGFAPSEIPPS